MADGTFQKLPQFRVGPGRLEGAVGRDLNHTTSSDSVNTDLEPLGVC